MNMIGGEVLVDVVDWWVSLSVSVSVRVSVCVMCIDHHTGASQLQSSCAYACPRLSRVLEPIWSVTQTQMPLAN